MFKVKEYKIIDKRSKKYLSFPDIMQSNIDSNKFFMVYREANKHHPKWSKLIFLVSKDCGETWETRHEFSLSLYKNKAVWNCPRLSYLEDGTLVIVCDSKSSIIERIAQFNMYLFRSSDDGQTFSSEKVPMPGMVPDKIIKFKDKLICANHKIKSVRNNLVQLVSWSRDNGRTWYDTNILADHDLNQFCEASIVKLSEGRLIAYLRDNSGHMKKIFRCTSNDGIYWTKPYPLNIYGQRPTAILDGNLVLCAIRNTEDCTVSVFSHNVATDEVKDFTIDSEYRFNQYHCGYTGMCKKSENEYFVAYYIKHEEPNPYIKLATIKKFTS